MKSPLFSATPEFRHFKNVMRRLLAVPKSELDQLVSESNEHSPRKGNPNAPGRKQSKPSKPWIKDSSIELDAYGFIRPAGNRAGTQQKIKPGGPSLAPPGVQIP
jgi:hypothetical protein